MSDSRRTSRKRTKILATAKHPSTCAKCASQDVYVRWHSAGWMGKQRPRCSYDDFSKPSGEHLHHYCRGCGYDWFEDVRDV